MSKRIKAITVKSPDGSPCAAPCAIDGCQYENLVRGWRPIETAPLDGTHILVAGPDGVDVGWRCDASDCWRRPHTAEYDNDFARIAAPTHWMPLPEPPKE
jgi:hypothetical protein